MGNAASKQDDQANKLREQTKDEQTNIEDIETQIDVLNLPPRKEVHSNENQKVRYKLKIATVRFIFILLFILGLCVAAYFLL